MYNVERKAEIINLLEKHGQVEVNSLARQFQISRETIRRDLAELEREGILTRTHGGAVYNQKVRGPGYEYPVSVRGIQRYHEKNAICKYAAGLIQDGDTVFVDNSSTTVYLARYIPRTIHATLITNSIKLLMVAAKSPNPNILFICLGGVFKESNLSLYGSATVKHCAEFYPNKAFMSCAGIAPSGLVTDASVQEIETKRLMIEHSRELFLLADYTKFSAAGQVFLTSLSPGNNIITDSKADGEKLEALKSLGVRISVV